MRGPSTSVIRKFGLSVMVVVLGLIAVSFASAQTRPKASVDVPRPDIILTQPTALKTGENQFEVIVKNADGQPINEAAVSVVLSHSRTATTGWMWKEVKLEPTGNGAYTGSGKVLSKGKWETTVNVRKDGKKIARKKFMLTAR